MEQHPLAALNISGNGDLLLNTTTFAPSALSLPHSPLRKTAPVSCCWHGKGDLIWFSHAQWPTFRTTGAVWFCGTLPVDPENESKDFR